MLKDPQPGSNEAIEAGCVCPVDDEQTSGMKMIVNPDQNGEQPLMSVSLECPVHGFNEFAYF